MGENLEFEHHNISWKLLDKWLLTYNLLKKPLLQIVEGIIYNILMLNKLLTFNNKKVLSFQFKEKNRDFPFIFLQIWNLDFQTFE